MVYSKALSVNSLKSQTKNMKGHFFSQHSHPPVIWNVFRNTWRLLGLFFFGGGGLTQAYFHVRLDCLMHHSWRDTVLYYQQPTGATGPSEPIQDQDTMLTQPQDNILQSYLCSASLVSLQPSLRWLCTTLCLPNKGGPGRGLVLPTVTPCWLKERKREKNHSSCTPFVPDLTERWQH